MKAIVVERVPVITEKEIEEILENPNYDIKCSCPDGTCYTGCCCYQGSTDNCNPNPVGGDNPDGSCPGGPCPPGE